MVNSVLEPWPVEAEEVSPLRHLMPSLGQRIVFLRDAQGLSRVALARRLGVSRDRLSKWELGKNEPPLEVLIALHRVLGVTLDELILGSPEAPVQIASSEETLRAIARMVVKVEGLLRSAGILGGGEPAEGLEATPPVESEISLFGAMEAPRLTGRDV